MNTILGYFVTFLVGISLGVMGSGGSILTVPNLVYLFGIPPLLATTYSLFLVGTTAMIGSIPNIRNRRLNFPLILTFGLPSIIAMIATRRWILPNIPEMITLPIMGTISKDIVMMIFFAIIMILAALSMIRQKKGTEMLFCALKITMKTAPLLMLQGIAIGCLSGLLGAGGGFLMIPGFVILAKVPIKQAIASSLFIVGINSLMGFLSDYQQWGALNISLLGLMILISIGGILIGNRIVRHINTAKLKPLFGYFILLIALFILVKGI